MQYLWINRSVRPQIVSLSELFLSIATGLLIIVHDRFLVPLFAFEGSVHLQSSMVSIIVISVVKCSLLVCLIWKGPIQKQKGAESTRQISSAQVIYLGMVKGGLYLALLILLSYSKHLSLTLTFALTLIFVFCLNFCPKDNEIVRMLWKGRNYNPKIAQISIIYALAVFAICLQPTEYFFKLQLHLQIFLMLSSILLIFSYFYLHKLVLTIKVREKRPKLFLWESLSEVIFFICFLIYLALMDTDSLTISEQLSFVLNNWWQIFIIGLLNTVYELVLWQHLKKVAFPQLVISLVTGLLWFNIYQMAQLQIDLKLYISVVFMIAVLLTNIGFCSFDNLKLLQKILAIKKKKTYRTSQLEESEHQKSVVLNEQ